MSPFWNWKVFEPGFKWDSKAEPCPFDFGREEKNQFANSYEFEFPVRTEMSNGQVLIWKSMYKSRGMSYPLETLCTDSFFKKDLTDQVYKLPVLI